MFGRIACIGGATIDRRVEPLERLRKGTSNPVRSESSAGGTARNVAEALARLGCPVSLFTRVGRDAAGLRLLDELSQLPVEMDGIGRANEPTASYTAVLQITGELAFGLADMEIYDSLDEHWVEPLVDRLRKYDLWILDGNLPEEVLITLGDHLPHDTRVYADPVSVAKSLRFKTLLDRIDTIFPDRGEALALAGLEEDPGDWRQVCERLHSRGVRRVVVTLGADGVWVDDPPRHERVPAMTTDGYVNVNGAGDCFLAGYVFAQTVATAINPVRCGLAAAAMSVESATAVPRKLSAERLLERYRDDD